MDGLADLDRHIEQQEDVGTDVAAAEATEATETVVTPEAAEETAERARDEAGRFVKQDDGDGEEAASVPEVDEKFASYLSRFGADPASLAELPAEVQKALQAGFEADGMTGRQGQELGELKKTLEQIQAQTAPQPVTPQQYDADAISDHFAEHPENILPTIQQAWSEDNPERRDMNLVYLGIAALDDVNKPLAEGLRVEIAKRAAIAEMSPHIERSQQAGLKSTLDDAVGALVTDYPDFFQYGDQVMETINNDPELARGLVEGTSEDATNVLKNLYKIAAFDAARQDGSTLAQATAAAAAEQAAETEAAKRDGFVATGAQRVESGPQSEGEKWLDSMGFDKAAAQYYQTD
jgi:hypothetical protein